MYPIPWLSERCCSRCGICQDSSSAHRVPAKPAVQHLWISRAGASGQGKDTQSGPRVYQHLIAVSDGTFFLFYTIFHLSG